MIGLRTTLYNKMDINDTLNSQDFKAIKDIGVKAQIINKTLESMPDFVSSPPEVKGQIRQTYIKNIAGGSRLFGIVPSKATEALSRYTAPLDLGTALQQTSEIESYPSKIMGAIVSGMPQGEHVRSKVPITPQMEWERMKDINKNITTNIHQVNKNVKASSTENLQDYKKTPDFAEAIEQHGLNTGKESPTQLYWESLLAQQTEPFLHPVSFGIGSLANKGIGWLGGHMYISPKAINPEIPLPEGAEVITEQTLHDWSTNPETIPDWAKTHSAEDWKEIHQAVQKEGYTVRVPIKEAEQGKSVIPMLDNNNPATISEILEKGGYKQSPMEEYPFTPEGVRKGTGSYPEGYLQKQAPTGTALPEGKTQIVPSSAISARKGAIEQPEKITGTKEYMKEKSQGGYSRQLTPEEIRKAGLTEAGFAFTKTPTKTAIKDVAETGTKRQDKTVIPMSESQLTREQFKNQAKGSKIGYQAGKQDTTELFKSKEYRNNLIGKVFKSGKQTATMKTVAVDSRNEAQSILSEIQKNYKTMSNEQLEGYLDRIKEVQDTGKQEWRSITDAKKADKVNILNEVTATAKPIWSKDLYTAKEVGGKLPIWQKIGNSIQLDRQFGKSVKMAVTPYDIAFDEFDGAPGHKVGDYPGNCYKWFRRHPNMKWGEYKNLYHSWADPEHAMIQKLKLNNSNFERIGVYSAKLRKDGIQKLLNSGYTQEQIDGVKLNPQETIMYARMKKFYTDTYPEIQKFAKSHYNIDLPQDPNYFPYMTDFGRYDEAEVAQRLIDPEGSSKPAEQLVYKTKQVEKGFLKEQKVAGKQKISTNAGKVFFRHMDDVAYLLKMQEPIEKLFEVANSDAFKESLGPERQAFTLGYLDTLARKGGASGVSSIPAFDVIRADIGGGILGFRPVTIAKHAIKVGDAVPYIGLKNTIEGVTKIATDPEWRAFIGGLPEVRAQIGDDPTYVEAFNRGTMQKIGMQPMRIVNAKSYASAVAGGYIKTCNEMGIPVDIKNPNTEALEQALILGRRSQGSSIYKDVPSTFSRGTLSDALSTRLGRSGGANKTFDKTYNQFATFLLNRSSVWNEVIRKYGFQEKDPVALADGLAWLTIGTLSASGLGIGFHFLTSGGYSGSEKNKDYIAKSILTEALAQIPLVGPIAQSVEYGRVSLPVLQTAEDIIGGGKAAIIGKTPYAKGTGALKEISGLANLKGIPGVSQLIQIIQNRRSANRQSAKNGFSMPEFPSMPSMPTMPQMPSL
jgi:hypothetical protein